MKGAYGRQPSMPEPARRLSKLPIQSAIVYAGAYTKHMGAFEVRLHRAMRSFTEF